jgi:hypothetical protein
MENDVIIFAAYPDTQDKLEILSEIIHKAKRETCLPVAVASHLLIPMKALSDVDYFLYDKDDAPSDNYTLFYHYTTEDVHIISKRLTPYHALSGYTSVKSCASLFRNKYRYAHLFTADTVIDFKHYLLLVDKKLRGECRFVGAKYEVPVQNLCGISGAHFSFDIGWFDDKMPEIARWEEWAKLGRGNDDNLMGENWLYNYFAVHEMLPDCYFLSKAELSALRADCNIQISGNAEPGIIAYLSELIDHRLILFVHLHDDGRSLQFNVNYNNEVEHVSIESGQVYWKIIGKYGFINVTTERQAHRFVIDPLKEYTDTIFAFNTDAITCLKRNI